MVYFIGMAEILWHRRETRRKTEKTDVSLEPEALRRLREGPTAMQKSAEGIVGGCFTEGPNGSLKRGLNERRSHSVTRGGIASGKQAYLSPVSLEDETITGDRKEDAPVNAILCIDPIYRTAVYVTRMHGGVGGEEL
jgi:hypothetical protein